MSLNKIVKHAGENIITISLSMSLPFRLAEGFNVMI